MFFILVLYLVYALMVNINACILVARENNRKLRSTLCLALKRRYYIPAECIGLKALVNTRHQRRFLLESTTRPVGRAREQYGKQPRLSLTEVVHKV